MEWSTIIIRKVGGAVKRWAGARGAKAGAGGTQAGAGRVAEAAAEAIRSAGGDVRSAGDAEILDLRGPGNDVMVRPGWRGLCFGMGG